MDITDVLGDELAELAVILKKIDIPLIVGGGYGLLLRQKYIEQSQLKTLRDIPKSRSTDDIDIFLSMEFVADHDCMSALKEALAQR